MAEVDDETIKMGNLDRPNTIENNISSGITASFDESTYTLTWHVSGNTGEGNSFNPPVTHDFFAVERTHSKPGPFSEIPTSPTRLQLFPFPGQEVPAAAQPKKTSPQARRQARLFFSPGNGGKSALQGNGSQTTTVYNLQGRRMYSLADGSNWPEKLGQNQVLIVKQKPPQP